MCHFTFRKKLHTSQVILHAPANGRYHNYLQFPGREAELKNSTAMPKATVHTPNKELTNSRVPGSKFCSLCGQEANLPPRTHMH